MSMCGITKPTSIIYKFKDGREEECMVYMGEPKESSEVKAFFKFPTGKVEKVGTKSSPVGIIDRYEVEVLER